MANISSYPSKTPKLGDIMIFSETYDINAANPVTGNPTKSTTLSGMKATMGVVDGTGTAGTIPIWTDANTLGDGPMTFSTDLLSVTASTTNTKTLNVANDLTVTRDVLVGRDIVVDRDLKVIGEGIFGSARIQGTLADSLASSGTVNQLLSSTVTGTAWVDPSSILGYTSYTALLTQSGTNAPVPVELQNKTTGTFAWTYIGVGQYKVTATGVNMAALKTIVFFNNGSSSAINPNLYWALDTGSNSITVRCDTDSILTSASFEIRVYE